MLRLLMLACIVAVVPRRAESGPWYDGPCGISKYKDAGDMPLGSMIVGGKDARIYEFPWQVSLKEQNYLFCGGSIINKRWILTAAHCVVGRKGEHGKYNFEIVVGEYDLKKPNPYTKRYDVELVKVHQNYTRKPISHDFALVKVVSDISFDESHNVQPVCPPDNQKDKYAYRKAVVSGWGIMNTKTNKTADILQYTTLNITTNDFCSEKYPGKISPDMVCTIDRDNGNKRDACQGDSGGPLVVKEVNGTFNLVGVVSWGEGCASGLPGVYSRITSVYDWILKIIIL